MTAQRTLDFTAVLSRVNGGLINQESLAEPHPRPTSAPPELLKITKESLFAYPPAGYGNCIDKISHPELAIPHVEKPFLLQSKTSYLTSVPVENVDGLRSFENADGKVSTDISKTGAVADMLPDAKMESNEVVNHFPLDFLPIPIEPLSRNMFEESGTSDRYSTDALEASSLYLSNRTSVFDASTRSENGTSPASYDESMNLLLNSFVSQPQFFRTPSEQSASASRNLPYPLFKHPIYMSHCNVAADTFRYGATAENFAQSTVNEQSNFPLKNASKQKLPSSREHYGCTEATTTSSVDSSVTLPQQSVTCIERNGDMYPLSSKERNVYDLPSGYSNELMRGFTSHQNVNGKANAKGGSFARKLSPRSRIGGSACAVTPEELVTKDCYRGSISTIAKDQAGGRMLQRKLDEGGSDHINAIYEEVMESINDLMIDPFGNYLCQKLMEVCSEDQMSAIISKLSPKVVHIALNTHGTRAVQKMIETLKNAEQKHCVVEALKDSVVVLVKDLNGNHVIQKCLEKLSAEDCNFIYIAMMDNCSDVASHRHGCCVLQRCIDSANPSQKVMLINQICQNAKQLVQDPFGNYVVQYILKDASVVARVTAKLLGSIPKLSKQKFSSNVVEKCMQAGSAAERKSIVIELLHGGGTLLKDLLLDKFANYVVQRALNVAEEPELTLLLEGIRPCLEELQSSQAGKIVVAKLVKKYSQLGLQKESCKVFNIVGEDSVSANRMSKFSSSLDANLYVEKHTAQIETAAPPNASGMRVPTHPNYPGYSNSQMYANGGSARQMTPLDSLSPSMMLPEHMGSHTSMASAQYNSVADAYVNYLIPPANYQVYYHNDFQQMQGVFSPMSPYNPAADMHRLLSSPANVGLRNSYSMTPLDLNAAYPSNGTPAGWTTSY